MWSATTTAVRHLQAAPAADGSEDFSRTFKHQSNVTLTQNVMSYFVVLSTVLGPGNAGEGPQIQFVPSVRKRCPGFVRSDLDGFSGQNFLDIHCSKTVVVCE